MGIKEPETTQGDYGDMSNVWQDELRRALHAGLNRHLACGGIVKNDSAFPNKLQNFDHPQVSNGLTKRELYAAMAMQKLITYKTERDIPEYAPKIAKTAIRIADALIAELEKDEP